MMAGVAEGPPVVTFERRKPLWLYPNLLSLDAPLVAVAWLYIFKETWRVMILPWQAFVALGLVVWVIYVVDRLLDASLLDRNSSAATARHEFHRKHRKWFVIGVAIAGLAASILVFTSLPIMVINYAIAGGFIIGGYFALAIFTDRKSREIPHGKNLIAGLCFAYGTAMLAQIYTGSGIEYAGDEISKLVGATALAVIELFRSRELICFGILCALNMSAIDLWEKSGVSGRREIDPADELALVLPLTVLGGVALLFAALDREMATRPFFYAVLTGAALLYVLNRRRADLSIDALRVLADVALLVPLLIFIAFPQE